MILRPEVAPIFQPFLQPSRYKGAHGGRGSGKSHFFATLGTVRAASTQGLRMVCLREVQKSLKQSAKLLIEDKIRAHDLAAAFRIKNDEIVTPGGGIIVFQGLQDHTAESIKSLEGFDIAWVEEAHKVSKSSWELLRPTIRKPGSEIWASWNPQDQADEVDQFFRGPHPPENLIIAEVNYMHNPWFTEALEAERKHDEQFNPDRYDHIWLGDYEPMVFGALWTKQVLDTYRMRERPVDLERIVVAVDHAVSDEEGVSNEHGIIAAGRSSDNHGHVLDDWSCTGSPRHWAQRAVACFDFWEADAIVIERNQGGDLVRSTLQTVRPGLPIIEVTATRGKHVRAAPIASMYSAGRCHHVGTFPELEGQLKKITDHGYEGKGSPDRADACVWAMTELLPQMTRDTSKVRGRLPVKKPSGAGSWMG